MRSWLTVIALSISASALAAPPLPHFEFKGVSGDELQSSHPELFKPCEKYMNFEGCKFKDEKVAGVLAFPEAGFGPDGKLLLIRANIASYNYDTVNEGFIAKWGKPASFTAVPVQNGFGATKTIPVSVWKFAEGNLTLTGASFVGEASFEFRTPERQAYMDGLKKPKMDF